MSTLAQRLLPGTCVKAPWLTLRHTEGWPDTYLAGAKAQAGTGSNQSAKGNLWNQFPFIHAKRQSLFFLSVLFNQSIFKG